MPPPGSHQPPRPVAPPTRVRWPPYSSSPFFIPVLVAIACRRYFACNGRIIKFEGGPDLF